MLQDILFAAKIHPRRTIAMLTSTERDTLSPAVKGSLVTMADQGGRDTERDLFGNAGGYRTNMSKYTVGLPCLDCGSLNCKDTFMGGSIYFCPKCQIVGVMRVFEAHHYSVFSLIYSRTRLLICVVISCVMLAIADRADLLHAETVAYHLA